MQRADRVQRKSCLTTEDVGMVLLSLTVSGEQVFSFTVGADGLFNRIGTGSLQIVQQPELCCGTVTTELFRRITCSLTPDIIRWKGAHSLPIQKGRRCEFFMGILFKGGQEWTTRWQYGAESDGPPPELIGFMRRAIELTDPHPRPPQRTAQAVVRDRESPDLAPASST